MGPVHHWPPSWSITASAGVGFFLCLVRLGRDRFSSGRNGPVSNLPVCYPRVPRPSFSAGPVRAAGPRFVGRLEPIRIRGQDSCFCVILGVLSPYSERRRSTPSRCASARSVSILACSSGTVTISRNQPFARELHAKAFCNGSFTASPARRA